MKYIYPELGESFYKYSKRMIFYYNGAGGNFLATLAAKYGAAEDEAEIYTDTNEFIFPGNSKLAADHLHKYINPTNADNRTVASKARYRECLEFFRGTKVVIIHGGRYSMFLHHMGSLKHDSGYKFKIPDSDNPYQTVKNSILFADPDFILLNDPWTARIDRQYRNASRTLQRNGFDVTDIEYEKLIIHQDLTEIQRFAQALLPEVNKKILFDMQKDILTYHDKNVNLIVNNLVC